MLAPVSFIPNYGVVISPDAPVLYAQFTQPQQAFAQKPRNKKAAPPSETHRAGDWVCILCHNLNYSFRKVCNRCQVQTKRDNLLQSLSMLGKNASQEEPLEERGHNVTPPGLSKMKDKQKPAQAQEAGESNGAQRGHQSKMCNPALGLFAKNYSTPKLTPKKGKIDEANSAKNTASDPWSSSQSTKEAADAQRDQERPQLGHPRAFQLFEGPKAPIKEVQSKAFGSIAGQDGSQGFGGLQSEEDQHDLDIWRSIDYVLDDCRE